MPIWRWLVASAICVSAPGCRNNDGRSTSESSKRQQQNIAVGNLVLTPASESRHRAELLPVSPTEDASHVLGKISLPETQPLEAERDYLPDPVVEWVVDIEFEGRPKLDARAVSEAFDKAWRSTYGGFAAYGRDIDRNGWTFLISADGPQFVDQLKFGFDFIDVLDDEKLPADESVYARRLIAIAERSNRFGKPTISASLSPNKAAQRSAQLRQLKDELDLTAVLLLKAPPGTRFNGKKIWDVMLCLGLEWGDMDCFHWKNSSGWGDDSFFSVETTTPPGYFLPEYVAAGKTQVEDLVFLYSVPRSAQPLEVFHAMSRAVEYCRSRLGGEIITGSGDTRLDTMELQIQDAVRKLNDAGFKPGTSSVLRLF